MLEAEERSRGHEVVTIPSRPGNSGTSRQWLGCLNPQPRVGFSVPENLDILVAQTEGAQPWRKVVHATNATLIALALARLGLSDATVLLVLGAITVALVAGDVARLTYAPANALFFQAFSRLASPREARGIASSTWYMVGVLASVALFPRPVAISGVLVLGLADPAAAFVGRRYGRRRFLGGTLEGSLACFCVALLVLGLRHPWTVAVPAAAITTLAERRSWPLDDNLTVPVVCAGAVVALSALLGVGAS